MERPTPTNQSRCVLYAFLLASLLPRTDAADEAGSNRLTPLKTQLPKPVFIGTPNTLVSSNLEKVTGMLREPFLVPEGCTNVALGKPVTGSDPEPFVGHYALITDGDKEGDGDSFVELRTGSQWVQVDLGGAYRIYAVLVWHYHAEARVYRDVVVQVSSDHDSVAGVETVFSNDHDNSSGLGVGSDREYIDTFEGRLINTKGRPARYVRLYSNGNTTDNMNDYIEVEVYGVAATGNDAPGSCLGQSAVRRVP